MIKKGLAVLLIVTASLSMVGCNKKDPATNQTIKELLQGYDQLMVTFFDIKNLQDSSILATQINDYMTKVEESKRKLEHINGLAVTISDSELRSELLKFINLARKREKLVLKYLNDIRRDLEYQYDNPDAQVNINAYIVKIPNDLLDLEYRSEESVHLINKMLSEK